jgi:hypothetical protein
MDKNTSDQMSRYRVTIEAEIESAWEQSAIENMEFNLPIETENISVTIETIE